MSDIPVISYDKNNQSTKAVNPFWWQEKKEKHTSIFGLVNAIRQNQSYRRLDFLRYLRLYTNTDFDRYMSGIAAGAFGRKISFNVARSCVDTACAKISKSKPRPLFLTEKGNYTQQKRAKNLTKYIDGVFYKGEIYKEAKKVFKESCVCGTGAMKISERNGEVVYEKIFIDEVVIDDQEARYGKPQSIHHTTLVQKEVLKGMFGEKDPAQKLIDMADTEAAPNKQGMDNSAKMIRVIESWHLRSSRDSSDGRHTITISNGTLLDEEWEHDFFPIIFMKWSEPILGFYAEGLVSQVIGIQLEINTLLLRIKEAQELMAVPRIFVEEG